MTIAVTSDVARYLQAPPADLTLLQPFLDAAVAWVKRITGRDWDATQTQTENFYNIRQGTVLRLKDEAATAVAVTVYPDVGSDDHFFDLSSAGGFRLLNRGRLQLIGNRFTIPFEGAVGERLLAWWARVKVAYTASGTVPTPVREAVALTAASMFQRSKILATGVQSEAIGDYSYSLFDKANDSTTSVIPAEALALLRPYSAARRIRNT